MRLSSCAVPALVWRDPQRCSPFSLSLRFWAWPSSQPPSWGSALFLGGIAGMSLLQSLAAPGLCKPKLLLCRGTISNILLIPNTKHPYYLLGIHVSWAQTVQAQRPNFTGFLSVLTMTLGWGRYYYIIISFPFHR